VASRSEGHIETIIMRVFSQHDELNKALREKTRKDWAPLRSHSASPYTRSL